MPAVRGKKYEKRTAEQQEAFLKVYSDGASIRAAARAAETTRNTVKGWVERDKNGFAKLFEEAQADFKDSLVERAMARVKDQKSSDSPLLLITMLNAYIPEKFRPNTIATEEVAKETIKELRQLSKQAFNAMPKEKEEEMTSKSPLQQVEEIILKKKGGNGD